MKAVKSAEMKKTVFATPWKKLWHFWGTKTPPWKKQVHFQGAKIPPWKKPQHFWCEKTATWKNSVFFLGVKNSYVEKSSGKLKKNGICGKNTKIVLKSSTFAKMSIHRGLAYEHSFFYIFIFKYVTHYDTFCFFSKDV